MEEKKGSDGERSPSPPKEIPRKRDHETETHSSSPEAKVRRVSDVEGREATEELSRPSKKQNEPEQDESCNVNSTKDEKEQSTEQDRSKEKGRDKYRERDKDKRRERGRDKDRHRKDYERDFENDPPANFERYWGAGPKRSYYRDDGRWYNESESDRGSNRNHDRDRDRGRGRKRDYSSEKVGPRYYGGEEDTSREDKKRSSKEEYSKDGDNAGEEKKKPVERKAIDLLTSKTGGAYIPPARLRMMQAEITDKSSAAYQRLAWEALKKSIHGHINKVNTGNLAIVIKDLLKENLVRGCGLLCRSIIQAQSASPTFTRVFAALVAVINSRVSFLFSYIKIDTVVTEKNISYCFLFLTVSTNWRPALEKSDHQLQERLQTAR